LLQSNPSLTPEVPTSSASPSNGVSSFLVEALPWEESSDDAAVLADIQAMISARKGEKNSRSDKGKPAAENPMKKGLLPADVPEAKTQEKAAAVTTSTKEVPPHAARGVIPNPKYHIKSEAEK